MEFRLTYQGPLRSSQREPIGTQRDPRADHKHEIRKTFHRQLKRLWATSLAAKHATFGFNFVPLVTQELDLICGLDILFLRPDRPGSIWKGDIDNRIKTLLDALALPLPSDDYNLRTPEADEQPFFCLLEEDKLITKFPLRQINVPGLEG